MEHLRYRLVACCFFLLTAFLGASAVFLTLPGFLNGMMYFSAALIGSAGFLIFFAKQETSL